MFGDGALQSLQSIAALASHLAQHVQLFTNEDGFRLRSQRIEAEA
jgi:hypothetical protein